MAEPGQEHDSGSGFPAGFELFLLEGEDKKNGIALNTKAQRPAIGEQEAYWIENFLSIGPANSRALWGNATAIFSSGTIVNIQTYNIGATAYAIIFKQDGSAVQIQLSNGATTTVGPAGTFFALGNSATPAITQFSNSGILIVSVVAASAYWAWDGTLWPPGNATSPTWLNGGTATAMPTGISGTDVEVFLSRVWIVSGTNIITSAPSNGAQFGSGGGLTKPNTDSTLRVKYTAIRASNGYLYVTGDSSCAYITNVQTSGGVTTYQYTVIDTQIGTPWRDSLTAFGKALLFANPNGIHALYGSSANKISDDLDGVWNSSVADFNTVIPSSSVATIFGIKVFVITVRTTDLSINTVRNLMFMFDGKKWLVASQVTQPLLIAPQETNSLLACWGTDGANVFQCFAQPDPALPKKLVSKLWGGRYGFIMYKQALRFYTEAQTIGSNPLVLSATLDSEQGAQPVTVQNSIAITWINNAGVVMQWQNNALANITWLSNAQITMNNIDGQGKIMGFTLTSSSPDFVLERAALAYKNLTAFY